MFFPMSQEDDNIITRNILDNVKMSYENAAAAVHYTINNDSRHLMMDFLLQPDQTKKAYLQKKKKDITPLTKKQVDKIHHFWGHIHLLKLEKIVRKSGAFNEYTIKHIKNLKDCEACKLENRRPQKPKTTAPRSTSFNHLLCIDLKENKRYKKSLPYILYMIDALFKSAVFIKNKQGG